MPAPNNKRITDRIPKPEYSSALVNFQTVCTANAATLGLVAANLTEISNAVTSWSTSYNALVAAHDTAQSLTVSNNAQLDSTRAVINKWAKVFRANQAIPNSLLEQLQVAPHDPGRSKTPPTTPTDLTFTADGQGLVELKWKRNGNVNTTVFTVETRTSPSGAWMQVGSTVKAKFTYQANVGAYIAFRVTASRNGLTSPASVPVVLWDGTGEATLLKVA